MADTPQRTTFTRGERVLLATVPPVATLLLSALCRTLKMATVADVDARPADRADGADIYAFFHRTLLLAAWQYRHRGIHILISSSFDGELIARVVSRLGFVPVRGSSSRGGLQGLLRLTAARRAGHKVALTVDGPRGPVGVCKPGAVLVARRLAEQSGGTASISAFDLHPDRAWTLDSWDCFLIPRPFAHVRAAWSSPVCIESDASVTDSNSQLQAALDHAAAVASKPSEPTHP